MSGTAIAWEADGEGTAGEPPARVGLAGVLEELDRLRTENRRLAVSLGAFSAFIASKGLLEEAWSHVNSVHQLDDGR